MPQKKRRTTKDYSTLVVFVICFVFYAACNAKIR